MLIRERLEVEALEEELKLRLLDLAKSSRGEKNRKITYYLKIATEFFFIDFFFQLMNCLKNYVPVEVDDLEEELELRLLDINKSSCCRECK